MKKPIKAKIRYVRNILRWYYLASEKNMADGLTWYQRAREWCNQVSINKGIPLYRVVGALSALSPGTTWDQNIKDTMELINNVWRAKVTTYPANKLKAINIIQGKPIGRNLGRQKVFNFFHNIYNPKSVHFVTVDRHAISIVLDRTAKKAERNLSKRKYGELVESYRAASKALGLIPNQLQAIVWLEWRDRLKIKGE